MAESEFSREVGKTVAIEEKCGLDMSSYQDLPAAPDCNGTSHHHNQANDLDNSYVFVAGADGLPNDAGDNKDVVEADSSSALPESGAAGAKDQGPELDSQDEKLGAVSGEFQPLNEAENGNVDQSDGDPDLVDGATFKHDVSHEDSDGVQVSIADCMEKRTGKTESSAEAEVKQVEDPDAKIDGSAEAEVKQVEDLAEAEVKQVEDLAEAEVKQAEDPDGKIDSSAEAEVEKAMDQNGKIEGVPEGEQENFGDVIKPEFPPGPVENQESQVAVLGLVAELGKHGGSDNVLSHINGSHSTNGECEDQSNLSLTEALEACQGSQGEVVDVVDCDSQDVTVDTEDEVKSAREVAEAVEHESSPSTSLDSDLDPDPVHRKVETLEEEGRRSVSSDVLENQQGHTAVGNNVQGVLEQMDESKTVVSIIDCHVQTVRDLVLEEKNENFCVSEVDNGVEEPEEQPDGSGVSHDTKPFQTKIKASMQTENYPASNAHASQSEIEISDVQTIGAVSAPPIDGPNSQIIEEVSPGCDSGRRCPSDEASSGSDATLHLVVLAEKEPTFQGDEAHAETEVSSEKAEVAYGTVDTLVLAKKEPTFQGDEAHAETDVSSGKAKVADSTLDTVVLDEKEPTFQGDEAHVETEVSSGKAKVADSPPATIDVKLETEVHVHNFSAISRGEMTDDLAVSCRTEDLDSSCINKECAANIVLDIEGVEDTGDQLDGAAGNSNENLSVQESEGTGNSDSNKISLASAGGSSANMSDVEEENIKIKTKPFNFLVRIPRFDDEELRERIRLAKLNVDEKTRLRDAIQVQIQEKRANSQIHGIDYEYAKSEGRSARKLVRSKRMEIDSLQSVINKAKNALSIEDIDSQIYNMEHMIQHETLPLKEEKQFIREIKQLKQLREQLSSNMGSQDEIKQAIEQREEVEERLKVLRKELDILKNRVFQAEATAAEAEKKYDDENKKVKELQAQFRAADDVRQAAYAQWQNLRKELSKKSKHFFKYKDDAAVASKYAFNRDTEALYRLCTNQAENFMELWNTNSEFRREYSRFNARSTVRKFGTLDGRALGPDEEPPLLPNYPDERVSRMAPTPVKAELASHIPTPEVKQETANENATLDGRLMKKVTESKNQKVTERPASTVQANGLDTLSSRDCIDEVNEEPIKSRDEVESSRMEEEMRREEAEAKLKEQRRLEALAKANEARERKKRQAEKLQMRAELKTQKEAEQREKEREKRLRKKERKKAAVTDVNDTSNSCETGPSSESTVENSKDIEVKEMPPVAPKKPQKPWLSAKQSKAKSVPPPLRNRNKKKWQQWMWVGITSFIILVLFWLGNIGVFSNVALKRRGPIH